MLAFARTCQALFLPLVQTPSQSGKKATPSTALPCPRGTQALPDPPTVTRKRRFFFRSSPVRGGLVRGRSWRGGGEAGGLFPAGSAPAGASRPPGCPWRCRCGPSASEEPPGRGEARRASSSPQPLRAGRPGAPAGGGVILAALRCPEGRPRCRSSAPRRASASQRLRRAPARARSAWAGGGPSGARPSSGRSWVAGVSPPEAPAFCLGSGRQEGPGA